jgi:hypothetical protein
MRAAVGTADGVYLVDLEDETILPLDPATELSAPASLELSLPRVVAAAASGSTVVAVVDRRPPLMVSHDAGRTWREAGAGLPRGRAVAVAEDDPDLVLYAARNRLYLSTDGGRFWRALTVELPEIERVEFD